MLNGVTQRIMAKLINVTPATISKFITSHKINSSPGSGQRNLRYSIDSTRYILSNILKSKLKKPNNVLSFYNFKGGVGKTSLCFQVSSHLALMGYNVLAVDADPQAHLSTSFGVDSTEDFLTIYDSIDNKINVESCINPIFSGLDLIPANLSLTRIENLLNELPKREERVKIALDPVKEKYDFIIFDTNPTISHLNKNIICYSDIINVVVETQAYALNGLRILMTELNSFFSRMQMDKPKTIIIPNKYEDRMSNSVESMTAIVEYYSDLIKKNFAIRKSEDFNTSARTSTPLALFCRNNSIALEDIMEITHYILEKL